MEPLNLLEVETRWGFRAIELYHGDITRLDAAVDVVALSAFKDHYVPTPGTVIGALQSNCGLSVAALARNKEYDLREALGCWVARVPAADRFGRLLCVEIIDETLSAHDLTSRLHDIIQNLFVVVGVLEAKGVKVRSLALPVLGAGQQQIDPKPVIAALLDSAKGYLKQSPNLARVLFVEYNEQRARQLDAAMNAVLERVAVLPKGHLVQGLRNDLAQSLDRAREIADDAGVQLLSDIRRLALSEQSRSFEIGIVARRLVEFIVNDIQPEKRRTADLLGRIERLADQHIADWIRSYMHVLRVFGNESAHEKNRETRRPSTVDGTDVTLCLFCVQRLLDFWLDFRRGK
jgi:O-acetyl-ADP-ribose deacetylase (regulator of RNase III)